MAKRSLICQAKEGLRERLVAPVLPRLRPRNESSVVRLPCTAKPSLRESLTARLAPIVRK